MLKLKFILPLWTVAFALAFMTVSHEVAQKIGLFAIFGAIRFVQFIGG